MTEGAQLSCEDPLSCYSMLTVTFWKQLSKDLDSRCRVKCDLSIPSEKGSVEPAYGVGAG